MFLANVRTAAVHFDRGTSPTQVVIAAGVVNQSQGTAPYTTFGPAEAHSVRLDAANLAPLTTAQLTFQWRIGE